MSDNNKVDYSVVLALARALDNTYVEMKRVYFFPKPVFYRHEVMK